MHDHDPNSIGVPRFLVSDCADLPLRFGGNDDSLILADEAGLEPLNSSRGHSIWPGYVSIIG
jgi:hypothetical protein